MLVPMRLLPAFTSFLCSLALASSLLAEENWPQFRGPRGDGQSTSTGLPVNFGEEKNLKWKVAIHGRAWSCPVIWGEQVWVTTANEQGTELGVLCLDKKTGKILRDDTLFHIATPQFAHRFNTYASPTPVIEEGRIYVTFGSPGTACLDTKTGKVLWQRTDLQCNHYRGAGSSPIRWGNLLIMNFDGSDLQYITALDKDTGQTVWTTKRSVDYKDLDASGQVMNEGDYRKAFATPHVAEVNGKPVLFSSGAKAHYAYEPQTGKELWRFDEHAQHSASTRPLLGDKVLYLQTGFSKGQLLALKLPQTNDPAHPQVLAESDLAWRMKKGVPNKPSMLLIKGLLYMIDDGGIAACVDAATGQEIWKQRIQGNYSAAPVYADGRIYVCSEEGKCAVFAAEREFKLLAENQLSNGVMAAPAISGKSLFIRTRTDLYRFEE
jgi:outer membrane protein assembly factor BamB